MDSTRHHAAALLAWSRRPMVMDAGLAVLLFAATVAAVDPSLPGFWWVATGVCVLAVLTRRRWPIPSLAAALVATLVQLSHVVGPAVACLAAPLALYTVALRYRRTVSLAVLGGAILVAIGWGVFAGAVIRPAGPSAPVLPGPPPPQVAEAEPRPPAPVPPPHPPRPGPDQPESVGWGALPILGSVLVAGWAIGSGAQSRRAYLDELRARARDLERERDQQAALAAAAERSRISRELHDVVAHGLSVIVMQAQGGAAAFEKRPTDTLAALATIVETGRASLADMRQVLTAVGSVDGTHPVPGLNRLPHLIDQVRQAGTAVLFHVEGTPGVLPATVDLSSYRIIQEALTNTMKHAGPGACAQVMLAYGARDLRLEISDNGATTPAPDGVGNGLRGMRERVEFLRGDLAAGPGPRGGFVVRARLPIAEEAFA
ncbi:sensor histidine kinase [Actinopolymorpha pittospori]